MPAGAAGLSRQRRAVSGLVDSDPQTPRLVPGPEALAPPLRIAPRRLRLPLCWGQQLHWRGRVVQPQHLPTFVVGARLVGNCPGVGMPVIGERPDQMEPDPQRSQCGYPVSRKTEFAGDGSWESQSLPWSDDLEALWQSLRDSPPPMRRPSNCNALPATGRRGPHDGGRSGLILRDHSEISSTRSV